MREIKFRVWNKDSKEMNYEPAPIDTDSINWDLSIKNPANEKYVWMQYTGLKDKNGTEIYEGDILKREKGRLLQGEQWLEIIREVQWKKGSFIYGDWLLGDFITKNKVEVIGNIYENPELLDL